MNRVRRTQIAERGLVRRARAGDANAYARLVQPYRNELYAHCVRILGSRDDADDAMQNTLLRAWRGLRRFEGRSGMRPWLYRIATNMCHDLVHVRRKHVAVPDEELIVRIGPHTDTPDAVYARREATLRVVEAARALPPAQRDVLILRDGLGLTTTEVARSLGTTPAAVYSAGQRARKAMAEQREPRGL